MRHDSFIFPPSKSGAEQTFENFSRLPALRAVNVGFGQVIK